MRILAGLAVGFVAGANWKRLRPHVEPFMPVLKDAADKAGDAYTTLVKGVMERVEQYADERAEARQKEQTAAPPAAGSSAGVAMASANGMNSSSSKPDAVPPSQAGAGPAEAGASAAT